MSDSRRKLFTLISTILGSTIVFLDATVVNVALPDLSEDLDAGLADQQWVVEAYLLALVSLLLVGGSLGDQFGRRRMFTYGLVGFAVTSVICALAPSVEVLIAGRAFQGFAGALLVPGSLAILAATFEGAERGKAIGTWTAWSRHRHRDRPGGGRRADRVPVLAGDLLDQRPPDHPHGADGAGLCEGVERPRRRPRDRLGRDRAFGARASRARSSP